MWTPDTTTQSRMMGTQALAGGISGGIKSLTDSIEAALKARKTESDLATSLRKKLTILNPDRKDEFNAMGLPDLTGEDMAHAESVLGAKRKMEMDQFKQRSEAFNVEMDQLKQRSEAFNAQQQDYSRNQMNVAGLNRDLGSLMTLDPQSPELGNFYENPEQYPNGRPSRTPGLMEVFAAASRHGQALNPQLDNILTSLTRAQPQQGKALGFGEDPVSGQRFVTHGNSVLPSGRNPSKQDTEAQQLFDADGNLIGHNVPTGKGNFTFRAVKQPSDGALKAVIDPNTGNPVLGFGMDANGRVHDLRSQMEKLGEVKGPEKEPGVWDSVKEFFGAGGAKAANAPAAPADGAPAPGKMTLGADGKYHFTR